MYLPKEDSYFLSEILADYLKDIPKKEKVKIKVLDMGSGSGIQAETMRKAGIKNIFCCDIDKEAIKFVKGRGFKAVHSNLFSKIKNKFNLIVFNPPYLPESEYDKQKDTTGGILGDETILKFLKQAKKQLNKNGKIFLLFSSLTPQERIRQELKRQKLKIEKTYEKKLFFETIYILSLSNALVRNNKCDCN